MKNLGKALTTLTVATALLGGSAIVTSPAVAQSWDRYDSSRDDSRSRYDGRDARSDDRDEMSRSARDAYDRGYRAGREEERRRRGGDMSQDDRATMEFLDLARREMDRGDLRGAWVALGRAETRLLSRSLPEGSTGEAAAGAAIGAIRAAREALIERDVEFARARTNRAMNLARQDAVVGRNVPGSMLSGAGVSGREQPFSRGSDRRDWSTGSDRD